MPRPRSSRLLREAGEFQRQTQVWHRENEPLDALVRMMLGVRTMRTVWTLSLTIVTHLSGCVTEPLGYGEEGSIGDVTSADDGLTVGQAVSSRCSTTAVFGLSEQLIEELNCLRPGLMSRIDKPGITLGSAAFPYLQTPAAGALERAARRGGGGMFVTSALRTLPQQYLLYRWFQTGRCGIGLAAPPGGSNHQSGLAVDLSPYSSWRSPMAGEGFRWFGGGDPVHFDYAGGVDIRALSTLAFQRLWNRNNPGDRVAEDGSYGPATEARLARAPGEGFAVGAVCGGGVEPAPAARDFAAMEVYWSRQLDGRYQLRALAPAEVASVVYAVDGFMIGQVSRAEGDNFPAVYVFSVEQSERRLEVRGYDASGAQVALGVGLLDVTEGTGVYIKQMGDSLYEIGLERAPEGVASVSVTVDERFELTDQVTGSTRSTRNAVRSSFATLGERRFAITTYDASGAVRGTLRRTFTLR